MKTFKNKQQVQLLALSRSQGSRGSNSPPAYRFISFLDVHNKKVTLFIESKLTVSLWKLKGFLVDHGFPPEEVDEHGSQIQKILIGHRDRFFYFVMKPGYAGNSYINGDGTVIHRTGKRGGKGKINIGHFLYPKPNFRKPNQAHSGTLEDWKKFVAPRAKYSPPLMLSLCVALSGYILRFSDVESGGVHLYGDSSIGKSTCLRFAASVCGSSEYVNSWGVTSTAADEVAAGHNDSILILDELARSGLDSKKAAELVKSVVYGVSSEKGKIRALNYDEGSLSWVVALLSSGESSLSEHALMGGGEQMEGEVVRLVDVPADMGKGFGIFESLPLRCKGSSASMAEQTNRACNKYHGTAKGAFIKYLLTHVSAKCGAKEVKLKITTYIEDFLVKHAYYNLSGQRLRIAKRFALAYAAGALAVDAKVLPFSKDKIRRGISTCFNVAIESQPLSLSQLVARAKNELHEELMKALESSLCYEGSSSFEEAEKTPCYITSIKKRKVLALQPQRFRELVSDEKVFKALVKEYISDDVLLLSADGKNYRQPPSGKKGLTLSRRYCFLIDELKKR